MWYTGRNRGSLWRPRALSAQASTCQVKWVGNQTGVNFIGLQDGRLR
jgi:hypothetical protein